MINNLGATIVVVWVYFPVTVWDNVSEYYLKWILF